jgi:hypothetical protein
MLRAPDRERLFPCLLLVALVAGCHAPAPDAGNLAPGQAQLAHHAAEMPWGPGPAAVPFECEMAVLEGSPAETGLFTIRLRTGAPWVMPPHSHPRAERVTVLSGSIHVGFGDTVEKPASRRFTTGDYYVNAPGAVHFVWVDEPVEIQITGIGPWEVHPLRTARPGPAGSRP